MTEKVSVAIICSYGLGDTFIQMNIANNLALNGYDVTFYSDIAHQVKQHVSNYTINEFPDYNDFNQLIHRHYIILYDSSSPFVRKMPTLELEWLKHNAIAFHMSSGKPAHRNITLEKITQRLPKELRHQAALFYKFNNTIGYKPLLKKRPPLAQQVTTFLQRKIGLQQTTIDNGLQLQRQNINRQKIIIHPSSSNVNKNWSEHKFIELTKRLKSQGFQPTITVSPSERGHWLSLCEKEVDVPLFDNIEQLATFYQDAFCFIGTDSGNAHLASSIGVPTLQVFKRWRRSPNWRAGWSYGRVIIANFPYCLSKTNWQRGLSVDEMHKHCIKFIVNLDSKDNLFL